MNAKDVIREYRKSKNREDYINEFCSKAITEMFDKEGRTSEEGRAEIQKYEKIARRLSILHTDYLDGWKLHIDWFACMMAQVGMGVGVNETAMKDLCWFLGWDFESSYKPRYNDITTVHKLEYLIDTKDGVISKPLNILLEPTTSLPIGSLWESSTNKRWQVIRSDGEEIRLESEEKNKHGKYQILAMTVPQLVKLRRVA